MQQERGLHEVQQSVSLAQPRCVDLAVTRALTPGFLTALRGCSLPKRNREAGGGRTRHGIPGVCTVLQTAVGEVRALRLLIQSDIKEVLLCSQLRSAFLPVSCRVQTKGNMPDCVRRWRK